MADAPVTLSQHLASVTVLPAEQAPGVATIVGRIGRVAAVIAQELAHAALRDRLGYVGAINVSGDAVKKLDVWAHEAMLGGLRQSGACAAFVSEESKDPIEIPEAGGARGLVVCCDPVDGSSNLDVNGTVGTIFALRPSGGRTPAGPAALGRGTDQIAAGYVMYGPATTLVYTVGRGSHGFTLNPETGEFLLTHPSIRIPNRGKVYGINEGNFHSWHPGQRAFVEFLRTPDKASGRPYSLRYSGAMVADVHRTVLDGGLFMYPSDFSDPAKPKPKLRLLYEVAPMAFIVEQAGGRASTGTGPVLELEATDYHQRAPIILGSPDDVRTAEEFYRRAT
ncbi:MAG TPA: class 1 fructose-bisphosphatase [Methylomirabilota bacterium]|jgi:fructose-1,6-bisphosphatase I|nr:class 1 fructose-bisphosphatase [Methylomirabilota bacterium]